MTPPMPPPQNHVAPEDARASRIRKAGRTAWALLGIVGVVAILAFVASRLALVVIPVVLALFPATLLVPLAGRMKREGWPEPVAALLTVFGGILLLVGVVALMVSLAVAELPQVTESAGQGLDRLGEIVRNVAPGVQQDGVAAIIELVREQAGAAGGFASRAGGAAMGAFEVMAGVALLVVALFFYLKDGVRLTEGVLSLVPEAHRSGARRFGTRSWETLGAYFRGQLLVALVDSVAIGLGLLILGIPLVLPLAILIFFGGLFPIVGAAVTGSLAVLVALADGGITTALIAAGIVLAVQQLEGNVLEPLILSHVVQLHPLVVILAITVGGIVLGLFGAFIAVPATAIAARGLRDEA